MLVANLSFMNLVRLILCLLAALVPLTAYALDPGEELVTALPLKKALESLKGNKPAEALRLLSEFKHDSSTIAQYYFVFGKLSNAQQKPMDAVEQFGKAYQYAPKGEMQVAALIERAETYLRIRYFYEARAAYLVFVKNYPDSPVLGRAYEGLARSLAETGSLKEALDYYEKSGKAPDLLLAKANTLHRLGRIKEADSLYSDLLASSEPLIKSSEEALYYLGENNRLLGRAADAQQYLSLVKSPLFRHRADLSLGLLALQQGKSDDAMKFFSAVLAARDRESARQALLAMADIELKAGKTAEAKARLEEIRTAYPYGKVYEEARLRLARVLMQEGNYGKAGQSLSELAFNSSVKKEALEAFEKLIIEARSKDRALFLKLWKAGGPLLLDASRETFLLDLADDLKDSGKPYSDLMQYLAKYGTESAKTKSTAALAEYHFSRGNAEKTDEYLKKLKGMKGVGEEMIRLEARLAFLKKDYKTASEKLLQLKHMQSADEEMLGDLVSATRDFPKAIARYEKAVRESGGDAGAYARLGNIMHELGRHKDALAYYRLVISKDPTHDWALYRIGVLGEGSEAEEALRKLSGRDPMLARLAEARLMELALTRKGVNEF